MSDMSLKMSLKITATLKIYITKENAALNFFQCSFSVIFSVVSVWHNENDFKLDFFITIAGLVGLYTRNQFDMYSFVSQSWCAFWHKNDMLLKWSIVKSTSEPKPQRKAYHLKDTSLLCDFKILFVRNLMICFYE